MVRVLLFLLMQTDTNYVSRDPYTHWRWHVALHFQFFFGLK